MQSPLLSRSDFSSKPSSDERSVIDVPEKPMRWRPLTPFLCWSKRAVPTPRGFFFDSVTPLFFKQNEAFFAPEKFFNFFSKTS